MTESGELFSWGDVMWEFKSYSLPTTILTSLFAMDRCTVRNSNRHTRGCLQSKLLMIPCNFPGKSAVEAGHWILAIREKGENNKHKLHILDSLGKDSGRRHKDVIANKLANTPFFKGFPKGKIYDVVRQTECECGARAMKYMMDITRNYLAMNDKKDIPIMIGRTIQWEKAQGKNEIATCRTYIKDKLKGEKRKRGIEIAPDR